MRNFGFICGFLLWLIFAAILACVPALPFWLMGFELTGCFVWLLAGMPFGMLFALFVLNAIFGRKDDRGGDDKKHAPDPNPSPDEKKNQPIPSVPVNRIKDWMVSKN